MEHDLSDCKADSDDLAGAASRAGARDLDVLRLVRLSVHLRGIARQLGALSRARFDSADFVDLLDASDAIWRAAVALDRIAQVRSSILGEGT